MEIAVLGLNHHTAPVELREKLAFQPEEVVVALNKIRQELNVPECVILSTCNRVELYTLLPERDGLASRLENFLTQFHQIEAKQLSQRFYWHLQPDSVRHLFRVAAGLDSMVVGESEILGQVREAYAQAVESGAVGSVFHRLFQTAIRTGKEVRSKTRIGQGAISVSSVAVELAKRIFQDLKTKTVLTLGAGQMGQATLISLQEQGAGSIVVANRSFENALAAGSQVGGEAIRLSEVDSALLKADIVICSTASAEYILKQSHIRQAMNARHHRPLFLIDISVPRNLDPAIGELENVYLYDIDDLEEIVVANQRLRLNEVTACSQIIEKQLTGFLKRLHTYGNGAQAADARAANGSEKVFVK